MRRVILISLAAATLAGCSGGVPDLIRNTQPRSEGPDEFAVLPSKPLVIPQNLEALPPPDAASGNLTDPTPIADAQLALGGRPEVLARASTDGALLAQTGRFGVDPTIRSRLASEDLEHRQEASVPLLERLFGSNSYSRVYEPFALDQEAEMERLRALGARTSTVPPIEE